MTVAADGSKVSVSVTNTGARAGATVVQVYVGDVAASVARPVKELKGFAKLTLLPGETRVVGVALDARAFAFFDVAAQVWRIEAGAFEISAGFSAADLRGAARITLGDMQLPL
jgi:beta-glucosidase